MKPLTCPACGEPARLSPSWLDTGLRSSFTWHVFGGFILVVDLDAGMTITNDAERVVEVLARAVALPGRRVLYRDTDGRWDELVVAGGLRRDVPGRPVVVDGFRFASFNAIGARGSCAAAVAAASQETGGVR